MPKTLICALVTFAGACAAEAGPASLDEATVLERLLAEPEAPGALEAEETKLAVDGIDAARAAELSADEAGALAGSSSRWTLFECPEKLELGLTTRPQNPTPCPSGLPDCEPVEWQPAFHISGVVPVTDWLVAPGYDCDCGHPWTEPIPHPNGCYVCDSGPPAQCAQNDTLVLWCLAELGFADRLTGMHHIVSGQETCFAAPQANGFLCYAP